MSFSKSKLRTYATLYINDSLDYESKGKSELVEQVIKPLASNLIMESKSTPTQLINEHFQKQNLEGKTIINDFMDYLENLD